jgi:hypothetical protein
MLLGDQPEAVTAVGIRRERAQPLGRRGADVGAFAALLVESGPIPECGAE